MTEEPTRILIDGPTDAPRTFVFAHGAGGPMDSPFMEHVAAGIAEHGIRVVRFEFPYMAARRNGVKKGGAPDRQPRLLEAWRKVIKHLGDPSAMEVTTRLNGVVEQNAMASQMVFSFGDLVAYCSTFTDLEPGDVIVTGTPGGVGAARTPPLWMKAGDRVEIEVKPIGVLVNTIVDE